jgi:hypothetical protein
MEQSQVMSSMAQHIQGELIFPKNRVAPELIILLDTKAFLPPQVLPLSKDNGQTITPLSKLRTRRLCATEEHPPLSLPTLQVAL